MSGFRNFKDIVALDVVKTFLDLDEFAEIHDLNGKQCTCIITNNSTDERNASMPGGRRTPDGLHGDFLTIWARSEDLERPPRMGTNFRVDGKRYTVDSCIEAMGMLEIVLGAYRMGGA